MHAHLVFICKKSWYYFSCKAATKIWWLCLMKTKEYELLCKVVPSILHNIILTLMICSWCKKWHLNINFSKCSAIRFSSCISQGHMNCKIDKNDIPSSWITERLGCGSFTWSVICTQAYKALHVIRRSVPLKSSVSLKKQLFTSLVKSLLITLEPTFKHWKKYKERLPNIFSMTTGMTTS